MKIAISGSNGYFARNLIPELVAAHYDILPIKRSVLYDINQLSELLSDSSIVINLAGAPILKRWTSANKIKIIRSRTDTTRKIVQAINCMSPDNRPSLFISASAIGIYSIDNFHTEESTSFSTDFIGEVVQGWENASAELSPLVRRVVFRIGLILGKEAKTIHKLVPVFKIGLGGKIGTGKQPFPFVHINDTIKAVIWSIENEKANGIYNLVAPVNINNKAFTEALSKFLKRPAFLKVPKFVLKIIYGEASSLLVQSPQVYPERLLKEGFEFSFPDINSSLAEIIQ